MNGVTFHCTNFLLHLQELTGYDGPVLLKEAAYERPARSQIDQLHNEYAITRQLTAVTGVRPVYAKEGAESQPVLIMEYIQGQSLVELIHAASLDLAEKLRLSVNVATVVSRIHAQQVMHKDLRSSNILVAGMDKPGSQGGVYVIDFGIASVMQHESVSHLAAKDTLVDTLAYISPEQTGRMNRKVDYRTDFYSLGVILYELFTGQLPFESGDALKMIHAHIARQPIPPHEIEPGIPRPVSDIVLKLLAKNAEDRYQTAHGLQADLKNCFDQCQRKGRIDPFELGDDDFTGRLQIPQKLYGRQAEIKYLQTILDLAVTEKAQLLMVAGYAGVGKTSLVHEIQKDVIAKQGVYIEGKFDQLQRTMPYSAWEQAFTGLVDNWLVQSEISLAGWRDTILNAVGDYGQVLIDIVPALERVLGPQPDVPELGGVENLNRIRHFFNCFINCLGTPEHPLVVFLDDLQWIDPASLDLIETLFTGQNTSSILVIGAYRINEVDAAHPLAVSLDRLQAKRNWVTVLTLKDLPPDEANLLLADTLQLRVGDCSDLGRVLVEKSAGNPFFYRQLLYTLEADGLLRFDRDQRRWVWDGALGQSLKARGSVVDLMIEKIRMLPADTQRALSMAACIGSRFDLTTLHTIVEQPIDEVLAALKPALQDGLIFRSDGHLSFAHDRIQEAGYSLIPVKDRPRIHLEIGRSLLARTTNEELEREAFKIVGHLNVGRALIDTDSERIGLAGLNLTAGQSAKTVSAFADAKTYVEIGLDLLGTDPWTDQYDLTLLLYNENGELAYLTGQYDQVTATAALIHANARTTIDRSRIYMTQIEAATAQSRHAEGLDIGLAALRDLGIDISMQPTPEEGVRLHEMFIGLLTSKPMKRLYQLPRMSDEKAMAASALLASIMSTAYQSNPPLFPIISYHGAILTFEFGLNVWSPFFAGGIAMVNVASITPDALDKDPRSLIPFIGQLIDMVKALLDNPITARSRSKGLLMLSFTTPWFKSHKESINFSRATYDSGHETGDWLYGSYGAALFATQSFAAGMNLLEYRRQLSAYTDSLQAMGQITTPTFLAVYLQVADNFIKPFPKPHCLEGASFNEEEWLSQPSEVHNITARHFTSLGKLILAYHFDRDDSLDYYEIEAERFLSGGQCLLSVPQFYFYQALSRLRQLGNRNVTRRPDTVELVSKNIRWMRLWSETTPSTFQHKHDLIVAEMASFTGDFEGALSNYEQAINGAHASGFTHEEALANELYARFWAERGNDRFAGLLMREAHSLYEKWGALAKAEHLKRRYPRWVVQRRAIDSDDKGTPSNDLVAGDLDLLSILKASQEIAGELELKSLLEKLLTIALQNAGAQQGSLIRQQDEQWMVVAKAEIDQVEPDLIQSINVESIDTVSAGIVHYVVRTREHVVLNDAANQGKFINDPTIQQRRPKSILCVPFINQDKVSGIVYLENNLATGAFTRDRVELISLLSSQMALALDNAQLYANLVRSEAKYRGLVDNSIAGVFNSTLDGRFTFVNDAMARMFDFDSPKLMIAQGTLHRWSDPKDREQVLAELQKHGRVSNFEAEAVTHTGRHIHALLSVKQLGDRFSGMVIDISDRKQAEEEIRKLNEDLEKRVEARTAELKKLSEAVEQSPVTVVITDKNGAIEYVNPRFSKVTGYTAKEAIGKNPRILKAGDKPKSFYKDLWDTILSGRTWRGEFLNRKINDEELWESASISPIKNNHGEITHFVSVKEDITAKKQMEEELIQSKRAADEANKAKSEFLANMSHEIRTPMNAVIGMAHLALKTDLTTKQRDYLTKIQSSANSLLGIINDILDFSKIEAGKLDMDEVEFDLSETLDNVANVITVKAQEKDNLEVLFYLDTKVPNLLVGDPLRLNQILVNLGNNAVKFTEQGEIVLMTRITSRSDDKITIEFSMRDTGIGMTKAQQANLFQAFSQADPSITRKFGGTGLGLTISKRLVNMMDGEIWVDSEPGQGTTFSFTANFGLVKEKVKKRFVPSSDVRGMKVLVVDDSATSREILRNILESFSFKVFLAPSGEEALEEIEWADQNEPFKLVLMDWKMSGMDGLETSRRIKAHKALNKIPAIVMVTAYGSEEIMRQADDIGTEGYLHKPVGASMLFDTIMQVFGKEAESPSAIGREVEKTAEGMQSIAGARVLLVEDNEINQQVAQEILQGAGLDVTVVNDGQDGVDAAMQNHYDVILMDIQMPVMDGYEATKRIRKREGGIQNKIGKDSELKSEIRGIPIIAMTAHAMAGDEDKSLKAGMNGHIAKPIDPDQLFSTLQKWIKPNEKRGQTKQPEVPVDSPDPDKAVTEEDELPESLPGFDLAAGLERLRGNKRLYRKLLIDFGANYTGIAAEISDALETKNMNHAHRLVHNLKGLAGNLAATALLSATIELEKLVKGDQKKMPPSKQLNKKLAALESTFTQALESIQAFGLQAQGKISKLSDEEIAAIPSELAQDISNRIRDAAQMGDVMTLNAIAEEIKSQSDTCVPLSKRIVQMAEDIDLDGIEKLADALEAS